MKGSDISNVGLCVGKGRMLHVKSKAKQNNKGGRAWAERRMEQAMMMTTSSVPCFLLEGEEEKGPSKSGRGATQEGSSQRPHSPSVEQCAAPSQAHSSLFLLTQATGK